MRGTRGLTTTELSRTVLYSGAVFIVPSPHVRRGVRGSLNGEYERKIPFAAMEMGSGNCITKAKGRIYGIPTDTRAPSFVLVWKNKQKIAEHIRHPLDEEKLEDPMTMFGKDDDPFKGGKEEQGPSFTGGK